MSSLLSMFSDAELPDIESKQSDRMNDSNWVSRSVPSTETVSVKSQPVPIRVDTMVYSSAGIPSEKSPPLFGTDDNLKRSTVHAHDGEINSGRDTPVVMKHDQHLSFQNSLTTAHQSFVHDCISSSKP